MTAKHFGMGVDGGRIRARLLGGVSGTALLAVSATLAIGIAVSPPAQAGAVTVTPNQTTTYMLTPGNNPITFAAGTTINTTATPGSNAIYGNAAAQWTLTNSAGSVVSGALNGIALISLSTVTNAGSISGTNSAGVLLSAGGSVTNLAGGTITSASYGVYIDNAAGTVTNAGSISGTNVGVNLNAGGSVTNQAGGTITGGSNGIFVRGFAGTVTNYGTVTATNATAIYLQAGGSVINHAGGSITGATGATGVYINGVGTVTNGGTITAGNNGVGVRLGAGGSVINQTGGTINGGTGASIGVLISTVAATVTNAGTISGGTNSVQFAGTGNNVLTLQTGSVLNGTASGSTAVGSSSTLVLQGMGTANNVFQNFGILDVMASGVWTLNGVSTIAGANVTGGTLQIGDAATPTAQLTVTATTGVSVFLGATLSGHGTIIGAVVNSGGTVAPGGSIGTLTVGSFTQNSAGTFQVELSPTAASALHVTGAANLAGTVKLVFDPGIYSAKTFAILTAATVTGSFGGGITGNAPTGITTALTTTATEVDLALTGNGTVTPPAPPTPPTPPTTPVTPATPATPAAPIIIAPTNAGHAPGVATTTVDGAHQAATTLFDHLRQSRGGIGTDVQAELSGTRPLQLAFAGSSAQLGDLVAALPESVSAAGGWFRATGNFSSVGSQATNPGFTSQSGGFLAGFDRPVSEHLTLGAALGYTRTNVQDEGGVGTSTIDTPRITLYGTYALGPYYLDALLGYGHDGFTDTRVTPVGTASSSHDGDEITAALQASRNVRLGAFTLIPQAGLQFTRLSEGGFGESGANGFDLTTAGHDTESLRPFLAVALDRTFLTDGGTKITPEVRVGYSREVLNPGRQVNVTTASGAAFLIDGISPSRDQVTVGAGIAAQYSQSLTLFADYDYAPHTGNETSHTVSAGLRVRF